MKKVSVIFLLLISMVMELDAQLNFIFLPEVAGRSIDGLGSFRIQNLSGSSLQGKVMITVRENTSRSNVVTIQTALITASPGITNFPRTAFAGSAFKFAANAYASIASQTKNFPPGNYTYCFNFVASGSHDDLSESCFDAEVLPLVPISLIYPADKDKICQTRPALSWQPPVPFHPSMRFRLLLTEKRAGESVENLLVNTPLLLLDNISTAAINYPASRPALQEGKTYCWQVIVYQQGIIVARSEIWEFTVQCNEPSKQQPNDSYRELKLLVNGNYYIANRVLKFAFTNPYNVKRLNYTIQDLENGGRAIKNLPEVSITPGLNKIDIDLSEADLVPGKHYLLKVYPFNEQPVEIRFIYDDKDMEQ